MREITYAAAIREAQAQAMRADEDVYVIGLGVPDPKGIFGTTLGLQEEFGKNRVLDMPCSENAMTGIVIGSALQGMRPILTHQRVDFSLLALDQVINNAAKWHYMFGGKESVPLVIRHVIGKGWGQGPQHSQSFQSLFAHVPGLKVMMPSSPYDAKGLMRTAIEDNNPIICLEHRWLYNIKGHVPEEMYTIPFGQARIVQEGKDVTIVAMSNMVVDGFRALSILEQEGMSAELIDIRTLAPLDIDTICTSVKKTGKLVVLDPDWKTGSFAGEIITQVCEHAFEYLREPPKRVTYPDYYSPTNWVQAKAYYPSYQDIAGRILGWDVATPEGTHDVPDAAFTGPF